MTVIEKVFFRKRIVVDSLEDFGFKKESDSYLLEEDFMGGDFRAIVRVKGDGDISVKVIDLMNDEEYAQLTNEDFQGAYISSVRGELEKLLTNIASKCCFEVIFNSDQANRLAEYIAKKYGVEPDYPWDDPDGSYGVFRHKDNSKWFALVMNVKRKVIFKNSDERTFDIVNLKADPEKAVELTKSEGIYPAYHMSHKNWISLTLDETLPDDLVFSLLDDSFSLSAKK